MGLETDTTQNWDKHEAEITQENIEENRSRIQQAQYDEQQNVLNPKRKFLHKVFIFFSMVTCITTCLVGTSQLANIFYFKDSGDDWVHYVVTIYLILMCLLALFNEIEMGSFFKNSKILNFWITRGLFYAFIGTLSLNQVNGSETKDKSTEKTAAKFNEVVAYMMIVIGILYSLAGLLCFQIVINKMKEGYENRMQLSKGENTRISGNPDLAALPVSV